MLDSALEDARLVMLRDVSMGPIVGHLQRPRARLSSAVLTHSWIPSLFVACLNTSVLLSYCLCLVDGALTEPGDCSDIWSVWYSSAHYTIKSRRGIVHWSFFIVGHDLHSFFVIFLRYFLSF